jgi:hypothetical protein
VIKKTILIIINTACLLILCIMMHVAFKLSYNEDITFGSQVCFVMMYFLLSFIGFIFVIHDYYLIFKKKE